MKEVNVDFRLVRHYDLHQLPVDRGIMRGLLEDSLEDGGDVVLYNRGRYEGVPLCQDNDITIDGYLAGAIHIVAEDEG